MDISTSAHTGWIASKNELNTFKESCYYFANYSENVSHWDVAWHHCASLHDNSLLVVIESRVELKLAVMQKMHIERVLVDATRLRCGYGFAVAAWRGGMYLNSNGLFDQSMIDAQEITYNMSCGNVIFELFYSVFYLGINGLN